MTSCFEGVFCFVVFFFRKEGIAFELSSNLSVLLLWKGQELPTAELVYAAIILLFVYVLIIFEVNKNSLVKIERKNRQNIMSINSEVKYYYVTS